MKEYNHKKIEERWQEIWEKDKLYEAKDDSSKEKYYALVEFPYPSGDGLHVGHPRPYIGLDIIARKRRAEGSNVLYPFGWDAFGLPTENYAIKTGVHPAEVTKKNTDNFRRQVKSLGISFDWSREINTTDPKYYKWTQWIFLKLFEHGLAYKKKMPINWCVDCKIGLANEEVIDGTCERCSKEVETREKEQWMLAITKYADRLYDELDAVDYPVRIKIQQRNWIGRSEGALIRFKIYDLRFKNKNEIEVFTTRPDTIFGVTYLVISPEKAAKKLRENKELRIKNYEEVEKYIRECAENQVKDFASAPRLQGNTGVELKGVKAINPANDEEISVWVADYVLGDVGTGAIMAVPAHDERDWAFAKKHDLPIKMVVCPHYPKKTCPVLDEAYTGEGHLVASGEFDGIKSEEAREKIIDFVNGEKKTTYKLRDWIFSRQRYWGEPTPLVFCEACKKRVENSKSQETNPKQIQNLNKQNSKQENLGELLNPGWVAVPEEQLPVTLPDVEYYEPTDTGESPLANISEWINTTCPKCAGPARRESDVMPNWAGSSWYYLRYCDPHNDKEFASMEKLKYWLALARRSSKNGGGPCPSVALREGGVDWYNGGMEHTTLHLLYSRFWHKFLYDIGVVPTGEPYQKRTSHGLILAEGGEKMSKSKGNVVNPDEIVELLGADTLRLYEMFMGPFEQSIAWDVNNIAGARRFLEKVWRMQAKVDSHGSSVASDAIERLLHQTIKKVGDDIEMLKFNTAISQMMIFVNELEKLDNISTTCYNKLIRILAPFAPHIAEELWSALGNKKSVHSAEWPVCDEEKIREETIHIAVQINGKIRDSFEINADESEDEVVKKALIRETVRKWTGRAKPLKTVYVKGKLLSIVIRH